MNRYDVILWDMDDTLLDFGKSERYAFFTTAKKFGWNPTEEVYLRYSAINDSCWKRLERGELDIHRVKSIRFEMLFEELNMTSIPLADFQEHYQDELGNVFFIRDKSDEIITTLKAYCRQYLVTNGNAPTQRKKIKASGFNNLVDGFFISEEIGYSKPSAEYFDTVLKVCKDVPRERILIVGDSLTSDMLGGRNVGIHTCFYNPTGKMNTAPDRCDYVITDLHEVIDIVKGDKRG